MMLFGVALSRTLTRVSIARARTAGFEMVWTTPHFRSRALRGQEIILTCELRNHDNLPTKFEGLRISHSPCLSVSSSLSAGEVPANGGLCLKLRVRSLRVGFHGIHNLVIHTIRAPGLYTVPLSFSNPYVIEVLPQTKRLTLLQRGGGTSQQLTSRSRGTIQRGHGSEFLEIREHRPGDAFRRIAWKASARKGRLLVIENEQEETDVVWIVVDMSTANMLGICGQTPFDRVVDEVAALTQAHLRTGCRVGLSMIGQRRLAHIPPGRGPRHKANILQALTFKSHCADEDRCGWDKNDVARKVLEHARTIDSRGEHILPYDFEKIGKLALELMVHAPAPLLKVWSTTKWDHIFRQYLLAFGVHFPPNEKSDRHRVEGELTVVLKEILRARGRPSLIHLLGHAPTFETPRSLLELIGRMRHHRTEVRFTPIVSEGGEPNELDNALSSGTNLTTAVLNEAVKLRKRMNFDEGLDELRRLGAKIQRPL